MSNKKSQKIFTFLLFFFCVSLFFFPKNGQAESVWQPVGIKKNKGLLSQKAGYETDITSSENGFIYVAFQDKRFKKRARVRQFDGAGWSDLSDSNCPNGLVSERQGNKPSLATKNNEIYVAFSDQSQGEKIRVKKWNGGSWIDLSDSNNPMGLVSSQKGEEPEIKFNKSKSLLYLAFRDQASGNRIKILTWNGENWLETSGNNKPDGLISPGDGAEVAISPSKVDDKMYFTFEDVTNNLRLRVEKFDGITWSSVFDSNHSDGLLTATPAHSPSIALDSEDKIYVIYTYKKEGDTHLLKWDGSGWQTLGNGLVSSGKTIESTVEIDQNNNLYVAMSQYKKVGKRKASWGIRVRKWQNSQWQDVSDKNNPQGFLTKKGKGDPALTFVSNRLYVSFTDYNFGRKARVMFFE